MMSETLEALYQAFAGYAADDIAGCPCCVSSEAQGGLTHRPLRGLGPDDLGRYTSKAMTTWGGANAFRHYLPRILEIFPDLDIDEFILVGKIELAGWADWEPRQKTAVLRYLRERWRHIVNAAPGAFRIGVSFQLEFAVLEKNGLGEYMKMLQEAPLASAATHLAELVHTTNFNKPKGAASAYLAKYLRSTEVRGVLENAFVADCDHEHAMEWASAIDRLRWLEDDWL